MRSNFYIWTSLVQNKYNLWYFYNKLGFYAHSFNLGSTIYVFLYIIVYLISFILIANIVVININMELYTNMIKYLSLNFGLLKIQYVGAQATHFIQDPEVVLTSYRSIYGLKTYILISLIGLIVVPPLFIIQNVNFVLLNILGIIFTRALVKDFYLKHFIWKLSKTRGGFQSNLKYLIAKILHVIRASNIEKIIWFLFKIIGISIVLMVIVRSSVFYLFMGISTTNWIEGALVITLSQPIYYYFMNFASKKLKKEKITSDDMSLFNNYVIKSTNLYRTSYLLCLHYILINYYYYYIIVVMVLTIIIFILLVCFLLYKKPQICNDKPLILESNGGEIMGLVTAFVATAPILKEACDTGYSYYFSNEGSKKHIYWNKIYFTKPTYIGEETVNIVNITKTEENLYLGQSEHSDIMIEHRDKLNNSPILNMAYNQKNNEATQTSLRPWKIKPLSFFSNEYFYGSVSQTQPGKFLIINIIREDLNSSKFMPTFYLPDKTPEGQARISVIRDILQLKYKIHLPIGPAASNGYMIFTQAEPLFGSDSLLKVWRPSIEYTQPESLMRNTRVGDYYGLETSSMVRLEEFNYNGVIQTIKKMTAQNCISVLDPNKLKPQLKEGITNELMADRLFRLMIKLFMDSGAQLNLQDKYFINNNELTLDNNKNDCTYLTVAEAEAEGVESTVSKAEQATRKEGHRLKKGKWNEISSKQKVAEVGTEFHRSQQNNHRYFKDQGKPWRVLEARRRHPVDWSIWTQDLNFSAYVSIYGKGVIEGFKESDQRLGKIDTEFELDLNKSRADLIQRIGEKYRYMGSNYNGSQSIYGISVNRLTFELFEVRADSNIFGYKNILTKDIELHNCEVYSIIDTLNDNVKFPLTLNTETREMVIPKHDYNFFDDKDEHSIRKFMDFIYKNENGYLSYKSDIANTITPDPGNSMGRPNIIESHQPVFDVDREWEDTPDIIRRLPKSIFKPGTCATWTVGKKALKTEWDDEDLFLFGTKDWRKKLAAYDKEHDVVYPEEQPGSKKRKAAASQAEIQKRIKLDVTALENTENTKIEDTRIEDTQIEYLPQIQYLDINDRPIPKVKVTGLTINNIEALRGLNSIETEDTSGPRARRATTRKR